MRVGDKDHFQCPDCRTLLHRKMFSSHPTKCLNKTEPSQANKEESIETLEVSKQPRGLNDVNINLLETYKIETCHFGKITKHCDLLQDESLQKISLATAINANQAFKPPIDREVIFTCPFCNFQSPYTATIKVHKQILHGVNENKGSPGKKHNKPKNHRPKTNEPEIYGKAKFIKTHRSQA